MLGTETTLAEARDKFSDVASLAEGLSQVRSVFIASSSPDATLRDVVDSENATGSNKQTQRGRRGNQRPQAVAPVAATPPTFIPFCNFGSLGLRMKTVGKNRFCASLVL